MSPLLYGRLIATVDGPTGSLLVMSKGTILICWKIAVKLDLICIYNQIELDNNQRHYTGYTLDLEFLVQMSLVFIFSISSAVLNKTRDAM